MNPLLFFFIFSLSHSFASATSDTDTPVKTFPNGEIAVWMCLERCGLNSSQINNNIGTLAYQNDVISYVFFERFNLGANSKLIENQFTDPTETLKMFLLHPYAMISSYPYPPQFLDWMRQLFKNPMPFINDLITQCKKLGVEGVNVDFEPTAESTPRDAQDYYKFLITLNEHLNKEGLNVTVTWADWLKVTDPTLLSQIDMVSYDMSTYTADNTTFTQALDKAQHAFSDQSRLGIGIETISTITNKTSSVYNLKFRLNTLQNRSLTKIGLWRSPVPHDWWPLLKKFRRGEPIEG